MSEFGTLGQLVVYNVNYLTFLQSVIINKHLFTSRYFTLETYYNSDTLFLFCGTGSTTVSYVSANYWFSHDARVIDSHYCLKYMYS
jgi:hypothetical protein